MFLFSKANSAWAFPNASLVETSLSLYFVIFGIFIFVLVFSVFVGLEILNLGIFGFGISSKAHSSSLLDKARPCQPCLFSMKETPFPFVVRARIAVGFRE